METQNPGQANSILRKKYRAEGIRFPDFILQSYSNPNSLVLAQRQTYRSMEQDRRARDKSMHLCTLSLTKEARIYNGDKTIYLTSGAGKTGQPLVKE